MKKILIVITMLIAVLLTSCSARYVLEDLKIDEKEYPGWRARELDGWRDLSDYHYLEVYYIDSKTTMEQQLEYMVFESSSVAKNYFKDWKKYCYEDNEDEKESGVNWFICRQPGTYDMIAYTMYYLEGNVIITSDVSLTYYSTENGGTSSVAISKSEGDQIKKYILDNHKELGQSVMKKLVEK